MLEKQQSATELDLAWRSRFGARLSTYRQAIYALTSAYQTALTAFNQAHSDQAQAEAIKDQVGMALVNVAAAGAAQPLLASSLGALGPRMDAVVELIENPVVAAAQGVTSTVVTRSGQTASQRPPTAPPPGMTGGDPLTFLTENLAAVEARTQRIEQAFGTRVTTMSSFTDEQWTSWDRDRQAAAYQAALTELDRVALSDASQLLAGPTLAVTMELYFWSRWIANQYIPGVRGLQIGSHLARRMKAIGIESLAGIGRADRVFPVALGDHSTGQAIGGVFVGACVGGLLFWALLGDLTQDVDQRAVGDLGVAVERVNEPQIVRFRVAPCEGRVGVEKLDARRHLLLQLHGEPETGTAGYGHMHPVAEQPSHFPWCQVLTVAQHWVACVGIQGPPSIVHRDQVACRRL